MGSGKDLMTYSHSFRALVKLLLDSGDGAEVNVGCVREEEI